jgi:hypothetical protein
VGLDNFASRTAFDVTLTPEDEAAFAGVQLCGSMTAGANSSFRGKIYWDLVQDVTGESLYDEWLTPATVAAMSEALNARTADELAEINDGLSVRYGEGGTSPVEMANLQRFFAICAERGLGILAWA